MKLLIASRISAADIQNALGKPEYSYQFLLREFVPALKRIGEVLEVTNIDDIDRIFHVCKEAGEACFFLSFTPPQHTPTELACPTISVYAWEFANFPQQSWNDDPRNDWRYVFERITAAIPTSKEAASSVRSVMGATFPVQAIPSSTWDRYAPLFPRGAIDGWPVDTTQREFTFVGFLMDSACTGFSADGLAPPEAAPLAEHALVIDNASSALIPPPPGSAATAGLLQRCWRRARQLRADMPWMLGTTRTLLHEWQANLAQMRLEPRPYTSQALHPELGVARLQTLDLDGVVYTTMLNPADGRKNWIDIVTAFCCTFRDINDATLIIKMTHFDIDFYKTALYTLLSRLAPFQCRVAVVHAFLTESQYFDLIRRSTFYINASACEGLCLPLMEFLSAGKPVIAPTHTAMQDYIGDDIAFLIASSPEPASWPHDPTAVLHSHRHRIHWGSLRKALLDSYQTAKNDHSLYRKMSCAAHERMQNYCSTEQITAQLQAFFSLLSVNEKKTS